MLKMFVGQANEDLGLGGAGRTVQRQLVGEGDARLRRFAAVLENTLSKDAGGLDIGGVIEQHQRLLRGVGAHALDRAFLAARRVKCGEAGMQEGAAPVGVQAAAVQTLTGVCFPTAFGKIQVRPVSGGLIRLGTGAADSLHEQSTNGERVVAHHLGLEPPTALPGKPKVVGILVRHSLGRHGALAVGAAADHEFHHVFYVPTVFHELNGQPIEQCGVRGRGALRTKIIQRRGQPAPVEHRPQAVDEHARSQRVIPRHNPVGKIHATRAAFWRFAKLQESGHGWLNLIAGVIQPVAAR